MSKHKKSDSKDGFDCQKCIAEIQLLRKEISKHFEAYFRTQWEIKMSVSRLEIPVGINLNFGITYSEQENCIWYQKERLSFSDTKQSILTKTLIENRGKELGIDLLAEKLASNGVSLSTMLQGSSRTSISEIFNDLYRNASKGKYGILYKNGIIVKTNDPELIVICNL